MKHVKRKMLAVVAVSSLAAAAWAQTAPAVENIIDDTKKDTTVTRGILDYKPRSMSIYAATKVEYDTNIHKTDNDALWDQGNAKKSDTIWKNTFLADYNFNTEEDHALGVKYVGEFDFYHDNKDYELVMHDVGLFYQYDLDPDPISARIDFDYKFIRLGGESFLTTKDTVGLIKINYNELVDSFSHVFQKGEYRLGLAYNQYEATADDIQDETGLDTTVKYKHKISFSKEKYPTAHKYIRSIDLGLEYKNSSPRNDQSKYAETRVRPRIKLRGLPLKLHADIEWIHSDRRYDYQGNDSGDGKRHDRRDELAFGLSRRLNKYVTLDLDYMRGLRDSSVATAEYSQNVYSISLSAFF